MAEIFTDTLHIRSMPIAPSWYPKDNYPIEIILTFILLPHTSIDPNSPGVPRLEANCNAGALEKSTGHSFPYRWPYPSVVLLSPIFPTLLTLNFSPLYTLSSAHWIDEEYSPNFTFMGSNDGAVTKWYADPWVSHGIRVDFKEIPCTYTTVNDIPIDIGSTLISIPSLG
jgi:hypothetical protein